jgi:hypothetical protein
MEIILKWEKMANPNSPYNSALKIKIKLPGDLERLWLMSQKALLGFTNKL